MGSPIYTLRLAALNDVEFLFSVIVSVRQSHEDFNWDEDFQSFKRSFEREFGTVWVIEYSGNDIGRLRVKYSDHIYVGGIQIMPAYQNKGIGSAILKSLIAKAHQDRVPVKLEVFEENRDAHRLYSRLGFGEDKEHLNPGFLSLTYLPCQHSN